MSATIYIPRDSGTASVGGEAVAAAISAELTARGLDVELVRNGSRGLYWLEPMIEVDWGQGRYAFGPVSEADVATLFEADFLAGGSHPLGLGVTADIPYLKNQQRLTLARNGLGDPLSLENYRAHDGLTGLRAAIEAGDQAIIDEIKGSGLRGRGGAAFPTGIKWQTVLDQGPGQKYIVCNADEGDSGTFADRMLMEGDPFCLLEGMAIAGLAVGADRGYIYLRSEYPDAHATLERAIALAKDDGWLGDNILDSGKNFDVEVRLGAGAYICGEETALLDSLEGKRGMIRAKPPLPAIVGLFGQPTVINNVISLASVPTIMSKGAAWYQDYGQGRSRGTITLQLAGNLRRPGLVELAFGASLQTLLNDFGGGTASGRPIRAVQLGGPLGAYLAADQFDTALDYEEMAAVGGMLGHGGVVVFDDTVDMSSQARFAMEFCAVESCGKCTPCRIGSTRGVEVIDRIRAGTDVSSNMSLLTELCETMEQGSLCAMGGLTPAPVMSALRRFPEDFSNDLLAVTVTD
ncbi:MAG: formate dehydrogenase iron-sulfur subunit [Halieaceae bacterium]|jgi:formate dehydrogenase iron-sulfur subunit